MKPVFHAPYGTPLNPEREPFYLVANKVSHMVMASLVYLYDFNWVQARAPVAFVAHYV